MLLLSFLVEVLFTVPLPMSFHATVETCSLGITIIPCQSCFHLLLPFASSGGKVYLPLLVGLTNKEDLGLFLLKVLLGSSKHVQQLRERGMNLFHVKFINELRNEVRKRLKNKVRAHLNKEFNSRSTQSSLVHVLVQKRNQPSEP